MGKQFNNMLNRIKKQYNINVHNYENYESDSQLDYETQRLLNISIKVFFGELNYKNYQLHQFRNWLERTINNIDNSSLIWSVLYYFYIEQYYYKNIDDFIVLVKQFVPQERIANSEYLKQNINKIVKLIKESRIANRQLYQKLFQNNYNLQSIRNVVAYLRGE